MTTDLPDPDPTEPPDPERQRLDEHLRRAALLVEKEKRELLATWLAGGGTAAEFEEAWPAIRAQLGKARLHDVGESARRRSLSRFRKNPQ